MALCIVYGACGDSMGRDAYSAHIMQMRFAMVNNGERIAETEAKMKMCMYKESERVAVVVLVLVVLCTFYDYEYHLQCNYQ